MHNRQKGHGNLRDMCENHLWVLPMTTHFTFTRSEGVVEEFKVSGVSGEFIFLGKGEGYLLKRGKFLLTKEQIL